MERALAFQQSPHLSTPLRFFLSAPAFALLAAILLLWQGPSALSSRWSSAMLALTHLFTLGFLASVMIGALLQILPVVTRAPVPQSKLTASGIHLFLTLGTLLLAGAFLTNWALLFKLALACLSAAFGWFLTVCTIGLWQAPTTRANATLFAVRMALASLLITVTLGITLGLTLAGAFTWPHQLPTPLLTDLHVGWGLIGWVGLLMMGVAFQVVPMFQVTPIYPARATRWLAGSLFGGLLLWSVALATLRSSDHWVSRSIGVLLLAGYLIFGLTTLYLLHRRKRPKPEATTWFWRTAMFSLLFCGAIWILQWIADFPQLTLPLGILFVVGFAYSAVNGMLYKIVPFLIWYHLQQLTERRGPKLPNVNQIVPEKMATRQFVAHSVALSLLFLAALWPLIFTHIAAAALAVSACWLWFNLWQATRLYLRFKRNAGSTLIVT